MEEEHKIAIQEGFSTLDKILAHDTWDFIKEKQGVSVYSTVLPDHPCSIFKGEGVIARPPKDVLGLITNEDNRGSWDLFFKDGGVVKKTSETSGYVYYQTHPQGWTVWPRDFVIAIEGKEVDCSEYPDLKEIKFVGTSVTLEEKPVISSHVRGTIHLGGYHLKPIKEPNMIEGIEYYTHITYILTVDAGGWIPQSVADMANIYQPLNIIGMRKVLTGITAHPPPN